MFQALSKACLCAVPPLEQRLSLPLFNAPSATAANSFGGESNFAMSEKVLGNRLLQLLPADDLSSIRHWLEPVELAFKDTLVESDVPISYVYFPESCVLSIVALANRDTRIEVGMVGFEGMTALSVKDGDSSPFRWIIQLPGAAWRMKSENFRLAFNGYGSVSELIMRYHEARAIQFAYTALAHGSFTLTERLARWLLMSHDRGRSDSMPHVHEFIASMLAVRRSGVSAAIHYLEGLGAIRAGRGEISIVDRSKLIAIAAGGYGVAEAEYDRLMAPRHNGA